MTGRRELLPGHGGARINIALRRQGQVNQCEIEASLVTQHFTSRMQLQRDLVSKSL